MAKQHNINDFTADGKTLSVIAHNFHGTSVPVLPKGIGDLWKMLVPYLKHKHHAAYVRDLPGRTIEGKYPFGYTPNEFEICIAIKQWPADDTQLIDTFAHELHHLARWQNGEYGESLGRVLITEGMACWFAEEQSGWKAPWIEGEVSDKAWQHVRAEWSQKYNHPEWFFDGPLGKWIGYRAGYQLAKRMLDGKFDLKSSIHAADQDGLAALPK